ncbi:MAG: hypothetical protein SFX73_08430 [Kofleriaceae bacterium]|nr:hypothetical protein [Kofleriaceae bacterium]
MTIADERTSLADNVGAGRDPEAAAKALLGRVEADVQRLDDVIRGSAVDKVFRRAWRDFVQGWRSFYYGEKDHPTPSAPRAAAMYASELRGWKKAHRDALASRRTGEVGHASAAPFTPGAIRYEWQRGEGEVAEVDRQVMASRARDELKRAWLAYLIEWRRAHARAFEPTAPAGAAGWRRARAYRQRTAEWLVALAREGALPGVQVGALFVTPGAIKDELETVNTGIGQLDAEIKASKVREAFKQTWQLFVTEWRQFYQSKQSLWGRAWGSTMDKVLEYKKRVDEWRAAFTREGGQSSAPTLSVPEPPSSGGGGLRWWLVGGLLVGGAVLGAKVLR